MMTNKFFVILGLIIFYISIEGCARTIDEKESDNISNTLLMQFEDELKRIKAENAPFLPKQAEKKFDDIIGGVPSELKSISNLIQYNRTIQKETRTNNVFFYGPPGTGKSSIAEALAGEVSWDFFHVFASSLITKYQGSGNERINLLFNKVRQCPTGAVVFIDEIDSIANNNTAKDNFEITATINAIHEALDSLKNNVICIVATNHFDRIPETIKSRFQTAILIDLPRPSIRFQILKRILAHFNLEDEFISELTDQTFNFSCRKLHQLLKYAYALTPNLDTYVRNEPDYIKNILRIACCYTQEDCCIDFKTLKIFLKHAIRIHSPNISSETLSSLVDERLSMALTGLAMQPFKFIKNIVTIALELMSSNNSQKHTSVENLLSDDLLVAFYYQSATIATSVQVRKKIINYFFFLNNILTISEPLILIAANELNDYSALELHDFVNIVTNLINHQSESPEATISDKICIAICRSLAKKAKPFKAKPFKVIEQLNRNHQYMAKGSTTTTVGVNISYASASQAETVNHPDYHITALPQITIEHIPLKTIEDFSEDIKTGSAEEKIARLELRNKNPFNAFLAFHSMKYLLHMHRMDTTTSLRNITSSNDLKKLLFVIKISCHTLLDITNKAIIMARYEGRNTCLESDLVAALADCRFNCENYASLNLNTSDPQIIAYQELINRLLPQVNNLPGRTNTRVPAQNNDTSGYCTIS